MSGIERLDGSHPSTASRECISHDTTTCLQKKIGTYSPCCKIGFSLLCMVLRDTRPSSSMIERLSHSMANGPRRCIAPSGLFVRREVVS